MDTSVPVTSSNQTDNSSTVGESCDLMLQASIRQNRNKTEIDFSGSGF